MCRTSMTIRSAMDQREWMPAGASDERAGRARLPAVERIRVGQNFDAGSNGCERFLRSRVAKDLRDTGGDLLHFFFAEAARRHRGAAEADAAGVQRRVHIERNSVLVY